MLSPPVHILTGTDSPSASVRGWVLPPLRRLLQYRLHRRHLPFPSPENAYLGHPRTLHH